MTGFPQMRYEVVKNDETICVTDCDVSAGVTFIKSMQNILDNKNLELHERMVEFRDHFEKKFVRMTYEIGSIE